MITYKIYDENQELFRIVKSKWERDKLVNTYKGFTCKIVKTENKSKKILESLGECLM